MVPSTPILMTVCVSFTPKVSPTTTEEFSGCMFMYHQESWVALDGADGSPCSCSHSYGRQLRINDIDCWGVGWRGLTCFMLCQQRGEGGCLPAPPASHFQSYDHQFAASPAEKFWVCCSFLRRASRRAAPAKVPPVVLAPLLASVVKRGSYPLRVGSNIPSQQR